MNNFAHVVDNHSAYLLGSFIVLGILGWLYATTAKVWPSRPLMKWEPEDPLVRVVIGFFLFGGGIGGTLILGSYLKSAALEEIEPRLSSRIDSIAVNGKPFEMVEKLSQALRGIHDVTAHHSHMVESYELLIQTARGPLRLTLCRDSQNPHEFWVFYDGFHSPEEIGRTFTDALDTELGRRGGGE